MTHIDPFAPADSPQHPTNFYAEGTPRSQTLRHEAMVPLIALADEPVWSDDPNAAVVGQARWEEYMLLIKDYGTEDEREVWNRHLTANDHEGYQHSVTEPSLATLRARKADATPVGEPDRYAVPDPTGSDPVTGAPVASDDPASTDTDLAQKLAALDEEDL